jgi:gamma-glutamylcyclotransferase (GGCT)/AIG2-like uncharacterized protein YtfP
VSGIVDLLFVYGTLQRQGRAHHLLAGQVTFLGSARLQGRLFALDGYPGAVLSSDPEQRIRGELYRMHDAEALLVQLDAYEEIGPQYPAPHEYRRQLVAVLDDTGLSRSSWTYLYNLCITSLVLIESGCWSPAA